MPNPGTYTPISDQEAVAKGEKWLIAQTQRRGATELINSRKALEKLGFVVGEARGFFYTVEPPKGWTKTTEGYWTHICDAAGTIRLMQFYKAASHNPDAFVRVT